ncbi:holin [Enterococcus sp. DIV0800]|uniref:holin n=1 Tax=unclassified Enterococcus TaxID=2608891 RepID=UPI003D2FF236
MDDVMLAVGIIGGLVFAFTSVIKSSVRETRWLPFVNVAVGAIIGIVWSVSFGENKAVFLWAGIIAGLSAGGFFDLGKGLLEDPKNTSSVDPDDQENNVR